MPHGGTSTFYDAQIIENGEIRKEPKYLTDLWTEHAVKFIDQQAQQDDPFFLFLAYNGPYSLESAIAARWPESARSVLRGQRDCIVSPHQSLIRGS